MTVGMMLKRKRIDLVSAREHENFHSLSEKLTDNNIGAVVVLDAAGALLGIVSERDLVRAYSQHKGEVGRLLASELMTKNVYICSPDETEIQVMNYMLEKHIRHMPVVDGGRVVGMISLADSVRYRLIRINLLFEELEKEKDEKKWQGMFTKHLKRREGPKTL